jgi:hypothetical protein
MPIPSILPPDRAPAGLTGEFAVAVGRHLTKDAGA